MAQVQVLQAQLAAQGGSGTGTTTTTTTTAWCYTFTTNLSVGMTGPAVTALQTALQNDGESVTATGTFDDQTAAAVTSFQEKYASTILAPYGLSNGTGYAGKSTRAELNSLFGCTGSNPVTPTPPIHVCPVWGCNGPKPMPTSTPVTVGTTTPYISSFTVTPFSSNPGVYGMSSKYSKRI
jgi:peptidoglycan hydrolase-like protein with peptidoglycan-binding domain